MRKLVLSLLVAVALIAGVPSSSAQPDAAGAGAASVSVQLLSFNDFHGNLEPPGGTFFGTTAGGAEYFATHIAERRATNRNTLVVGAGDMIGGTPLLSALFHDEPTVESLGAAGLQITSVGNHEFDEGRTELLRMQRGGCHARDGCQDGDGFAGARFRYLSANVELAVTAAESRAHARASTRYRRALRARAAACRRSARSRACTRKLVRPQPLGPKALLPATEIRTIGGVRIGFIGMTLEGTPQIVTPSGVAGLLFRDEAAIANRYAAELRRKGVRAIVVLLHEGGFQAGSFNDCDGISGAIVDIAGAITDDVDVIVSGHTHQAYNCTIGRKLVTSASAFGRLLTDIELTIDSSSGEVTAKTATNVIVTRTVAKDPVQTRLIEKYTRIAAPLANRVIGSITADITRAETPAGESALGDVIADAQLAATRTPTKGGAQIAFMNPGGIRAELLASQVSGGEAPGQVTYSEAFTVQPFGNSLVTMTLTGQQIDTLLEQQWSGANASRPRILQVSNGFSYTYDPRRPATDRVDVAAIRLNGTPIGSTASYRVTVNSFLADGGDNFSVLREGTSRLGGDVDVDALEAYFRANSPVAPGPRTRITRAS